MCAIAVHLQPLLDDTLCWPPRRGAELGLDVEAFLRDLESEQTAARVRADVSAEASGARGTPTFFIDNHRHTGPHDTETLARALEASRHRSGVARGR